jgi:hypothetical protein
MDILQSPQIIWSTLLLVLQKKERYSLGDSVVSEDIWKLFFSMLNKQPFPNFKIAQFLSQRIDFANEGNCIRGFLHVFCHDHIAIDPDIALFLEQNYLETEPLYQNIYQIWRRKWLQFLPDTNHQHR